MHERGHISRAIAQFLEAAEQMPSRVEVSLGPGMVEEVALAAWEQTVAGTAAEGVEVSWLRAADLLQCVECGSEFPGGKLDRCPDCGGNGLVVEPAPEIDIVATGDPLGRTNTT